MNITFPCVEVGVTATFCLVRFGNILGEFLYFYGPEQGSSRETFVHENRKAIVVLKNIHRAYFECYSSQSSQYCPWFSHRVVPLNV